MLHPINDLTLSIPISPAARKQAERFARDQPTAEKAQQVYRNTLAVLVVQTYLEMMDIPTDLPASDSWRSSDRLCLDVADLVIVGVGHLECRPIRADEFACMIPAEVCTDRIGYVVVQLQQDYRAGRLLGFVPTVIANPLPTSQLRSLDALLVHLHACRPQTMTHLSRWFDQVFTASWQVLEEVFSTRSAAVSFLSYRLPVHPGMGRQELLHLIQTTQDEEVRWKAMEQLWETGAEYPNLAVRRILDLGLQLAGQAVALMVAILRKPDQSVAVLLRVYPMGSQPYLPGGLQLVGFDSQGQPFLEAVAREQDDYIQLKFSAELGEHFGVRVSWAEASITEHFVV